MSKSIIGTFLQSGGTYTTMRTVNKTSIFALQSHIQRLADFKSHVIADYDTFDSQEPLTPFSYEETAHFVMPYLQEVLRKEYPHRGEFTVQVALRRKKKYRKIPIRELQIANHLELMVSAKPLPKMPETVHVDTLKYNRQNTMKNGTWIIEREQLRQPYNNSNETILLNDALEMYEGLSSNIAVIDCRKNLIIPPKNKVLEGTVLLRLINAAQQRGITIKREFPTFSLLRAYDSILLCSTSRLVVPVDTILSPTRSIVICHKCPLAIDLASHVKDTLDQHSEPYF